MANYRFIFQSASEALQYLEDIAKIEDITLTRDDYPQWYSITAKSLHTLAFPAHLRDVCGAIKIAWDEHLEEQWETDDPEMGVEM